jgi:nucleotide-binding universal stress UspA family protein
MPNAHRILYVVTFDSSEAAISDQVTELARAQHAAVVLLAARPRRRWKIGMARGAEGTGRKLSAIAARMKGYAADIRVVDPPLPESAMRIADEVAAELIVIGAGERADREPTYTSPEALKLAREAREDVLICKPFADRYVGHVLCAADTTPTSGAAVLRSVQISRRFNALLRIVSVMPEPSWKSASADPDEDIRNQHEAQKAFLDQFDLRGVGLSRAVVWSRHAAAEVLDEADRYSEGLLVIGASSRAPLPKGQLGPTSEAIVSACPCSLMIVKGQKAVGANAPAASSQSGTRALTDA